MEPTSEEAREPCSLGDAAKWVGNEAEECSMRKAIRVRSAGGGEQVAAQYGREASSRWLP